MKIKKNHYDYLKNSIELFVNNNPDIKEKYKSKGLSENRFIWNIFNCSIPSKWVCDNLYPYLNDTHIETALKKILKERGLE